MLLQASATGPLATAKTTAAQPARRAAGKAAVSPPQKTQQVDKQASRRQPTGLSKDAPAQPKHAGVVHCWHASVTHVSISGSWLEPRLANQSQRCMMLPANCHADFVQKPAWWRQILTTAVRPTSPLSAWCLACMSADLMLWLIKFNLCAGSASTSSGRPAARRKDHSSLLQQLKEAQAQADAVLASSRASMEARLAPPASGPVFCIYQSLLQQACAEPRVHCPTCCPQLRLLLHVPLCWGVCTQSGL